mmetsp:Transcript_26981/g.41374  ORF Transcript_26981/g.41374 Transcript_26981/m.41374 type:complete len:478 (+) Transcript_26981:125-1558(+)|eukprot:CAMPEP_0195289974 /NCGR_PEP_ID=MMETSP0707-20130614/6028_1 /TAXON_ID=33640 /ORGANISM="Asterionellopsis glacialis, Strain CCMP134" /LENGTH=477 /DNA_ID=CAMNT_0040350039 /DNA_START=109 /DNA_END=1542 /DNA_ORIENTATION=+
MSSNNHTNGIGNGADISSSSSLSSSAFHVRLTYPSALEGSAQEKTTSSPPCSLRVPHLPNNKNKEEESSHRLVAVRYFLDRPGYDLSHSSVRLWHNPPPKCTACDIQKFLHQLGIEPRKYDLLVEIHIDQLQSYMMIDACITSGVLWDFSDVTYTDPGILNIRLTDLAHAQELDKSYHSLRSLPTGTHPGISFPSSQLSMPSVQPLAPQPIHNLHSQHANTIPIGLFAFSISLGLETAELMGHLVPGTVSKAFVLTFGPYMLMVGGLIEFSTGVFQIFRNNIYGATAFMGFGSFWFANGLALILKTFFSGDIPDEIFLDTDDPWGHCIRSLFILAFAAVLLMQTFAMNKLSSMLMFLVCCKVSVGAFTGWSESLKWAQLGLGYVSSAFAFYVFTTELTNQVYHREVLPVFKWSEKDSPEETFGAAGRPVGTTLYSRAVRLRQASAPTIPGVRSLQLPASVHTTTSTDSRIETIDKDV